MNNDDIIYAYPKSVLDDNEYDLDGSALENLSFKKSKCNKIVFLSAAMMLFFLLYCIPALADYDYIFLFVSAIIFLIMYFYARQIGTLSPSAALSILALKNKMYLKFYTGKLKKELEVYYEDIETARFLDRDHTRLEIIFKSNNRSHAYQSNISGTEKAELNGVFFFSVRKFSYEQFFFLYIAEDLFTMKKLHKTKRFYKRYGNKREYLERLERRGN